MRIEIQVPLETHPNEFDKLMEEAAKPYGYIIQRRSNMPVGYTATIVVPRDPTSVPYYALSAELYKLKEGDRAR